MNFPKHTKSLTYYGMEWNGIYLYSILNISAIKDLVWVMRFKVIKYRKKGYTQIMCIRVYYTLILGKIMKFNSIQYYDIKENDEFSPNSASSFSPDGNKYPALCWLHVLPLFRLNAGEFELSGTH